MQSNVELVLPRIIVERLGGVIAMACARETLRTNPSPIAKWAMFNAAKVASLFVFGATIIIRRICPARYCRRPRLAIGVAPCRGLRENAKLRHIKVAIVVPKVATLDMSCRR